MDIQLKDFDKKKKNKTTKPTGADKQLSIVLNTEDWEDLGKFINHQKAKKIKYNKRKAIIYGLDLMMKRYPNLKSVGYIKLRGGRNANKGERGVETKQTTVRLEQKYINFINDYNYYKMAIIGNINQRRYDLFTEMLQLIKEENSI